MKIKKSKLEKVVREALYREIGKKVFTEGRVDELFGLFGGGDIDLGEKSAAAQELMNHEPKSGGVGKKIQDAIDAGLDDYITIQQVWNKLGEAVVNGHFLDAKDPTVKKIQKSWADKQEEPRRSLYAMIFEKASSNDVHKAIEAQIKRAK